MLLYERMQHAPPLYDYMHRVSLHMVDMGSLGCPQVLLETLKTDARTFKSSKDLLNVGYCATLLSLQSKFEVALHVEL